jgi:hypothetical protein
MSAVPEAFMHEPSEPRKRQVETPRREPATDTPEQKFWHWFAIGVLLFCWIAEATMCADRGF